jgi:Globin
LFKAHPDAIKLFPIFAGIPVTDLATNSEFLAYGNMFSAGLNFMIDNIDNPIAIKQILATKDASKYFLPGVSIRQQLEVTTCSI